MLIETHRSDKMIATPPALAQLWAAVRKRLVSDAQDSTGTRIGKRAIFGAVLMLFVLLLVIAWWQRTSIADRFVQNTLAEYDVTATYNIENVGLRTQRVTDLVIGDPASPDLTIAALEVDLKIGFTGANVQWVRTNGVRLRGKLLDDGTFDLGELNKFFPEPTGEPFEFPDIALDIDDAIAALSTPYGPVGASLTGFGQLRGQFDGEVALNSPDFAYGGCRAERATFAGDIALSSGSPNLSGPITAQRIACPQQSVALTRPVIDAKLQLNKSLDRWVGSVGFAATTAEYDGQQLVKPAGNLAFEGSAERTNFDLTLNDGAFRNQDIRIGLINLDGEGRVGFAEDGFTMAMRGDAEIARARLDRAALTMLDNAAGNTRGTPLGPLLERITPAARRALSSFDAGAIFDVTIPARAAAKIDITAFDAASASGAKLRQTGALRLIQRAAGWSIASPVQIALSGGGLPDGRLSLRRAGQGWAGSLAFAAYAAADARLAINDLTFSGRPGGAWNFNGNATLSGPLAGGRVDGLRLPIEGRWNGALLSMYNSCQQLRFERATLSGFQIAGQSLRICPDGGSIVTLGDRTRVNALLPGLSVRGSSGGTPFRIASQTLNFRLDEGLRARNVSVAVGSTGSETAFDIGSINGRFGPQGLSGILSGASGQIANVPFLLSDINGKWDYRGGAIRLQGDLNFTDAKDVDRFFPMSARDVVVDYENGTISAVGDIYEPTTNTRVGGTDILHSLNNSTGRALIAVDGLAFNSRFQPELLTPLTLGVVANVEGVVNGDGRIEWDDSNDGIRSTGLFGTDSLDLAAAFGPVRGLKTQLKFTDLLSLETAPGQLATIESINPGVAALGGLVKYNLRANQKVEIEAGEWPFAGGTLTLDRTVWDLGEDSPRHLAFRVNGVEVDRFLAQFDLSNLSATGTFDGVLPMVFDQDGGRIVGGELISRANGGNISYIGDLTYEDLSPYANFAFDALRSLDYSSLRLGLNGELEGEIITVINLKGVKQGRGAKRNFITRQLAKIPIEFNLQIEAQFFQLMTSVRSFYDPEFLVQRNLPALLEQQQKRAKELAAQTVQENDDKAEQPVQPFESDRGL